MSYQPRISGGAGGRASGIQVFGDVETRIAILEQGVTWEALALTEAWANLGSGNQIAQIGTDGAKKVYIRGIVKSVKPYAFPNTNIIVGIIPESLRPKETQYGGVAFQKDSAGNFAVLPIAISNGGAVQLTFGNSDVIGGTNGTANYLLLPQIIYTIT